LVVQDEGTCVDGVSQLVEEDKAVPTVGVGLGSVERHARLCAFGFVHGYVGAAEEFTGR
jgi:hypothetical protein